MPNIREKSGTFTNVSPSKHNWISGYIGINGVYITCKANFDSARVELELNMSQKEKNKALFDYLYSYKDDIENNIEQNFIWERKDDTKVSKIYLNLPGVNVSNDNDWSKMSDFHAEGSKIIIDSFSDILRQYS